MYEGRIARPSGRFAARLKNRLTLNIVNDSGRRRLEFGRAQLAQWLSQALEHRLRRTVDIESYRAAAVFVPLLESDQGWELLFTIRSQQLSNHAGQISFPGGRVDDGETLEKAAIREMQEEIGAQPDRVIGLLDDHPSPAGYIVTPFVGMIEWPQTLDLNAAEVESVFSVPLSRLAGIQPRIETRMIENFQRNIHFYDYDERTIWGLTANIVKNLMDILEH